MNKQQLRFVFWISFVLAASSLAALGIIDEKLKGPDIPFGIISFELCAYTANCDAMVSSWTGITQAMAAMSLGVDYLFMVAYPAVICFGLLIGKAALPAPLQRVATALAAIVWVAGLADAVENYHLFQMLVGQSVEQHAWPATIAATIKFVLLIPALVLWIGSGFCYFYSKGKPRNA